MDDTFWWVSGKPQCVASSCTYLEANGLKEQTRRGGCGASCQLCYNTQHAQDSSLESRTYDALVSVVVSQDDQRRYNAYLTFPTPLMTPPDTSTYFMTGSKRLRRSLGEGGGKERTFCDSKKFVVGGARAEHQGPVTALANTSALGILQPQPNSTSPHFTPLHHCVTVHCQHVTHL
jgi:hypothetical protein